MAIYAASSVFYDDNCSDNSSWANSDAGDGVSSQVTSDGKTTFKSDNGSAGSGNYALITKDVGSFGNRVVAQISIYHAALSRHYACRWKEI